MSKTNESTKFCIRCPGKDRHLMSCPVHKGGKVKSDEPWHGEQFTKKNKQIEIVNVLFQEKELKVPKKSQNSYDVEFDGIVKHPDCTAEDVIRALAFYMHGVQHRTLSFSKVVANSKKGVPYRECRKSDNGFHKYDRDRVGCIYCGE